MGQGHTLMQHTHVLAEYLASKLYGMWLKGKFKLESAVCLAQLATIHMIRF